MLLLSLTIIVISGHSSDGNVSQRVKVWCCTGGGDWVGGQLTLWAGSLVVHQGHDGLTG